ncbi:MAG: glycerophosphodiester phosphodiesterase [Alphaproteobacteria bacterium]|nr:glycerophosphodiester phosphodiesterase [Alphaproteobacteria bacterium]
MKLPVIIGHRGAKSNAPENTLAGLRRAHEEGAPWVEFDVKLTKDNVPVLIHDETLERTTNGRGPVRDLTLASIKLVDAGCPAQFGDRFKGERIPTLEEALTLLRELGMGFNLEIKPCPGRERETAVAAVRMVQRLWPAQAPVPIISSFKLPSLEAARATAPALPRGYLAERLEAGWVESAKRLDCATIHPGYRALTVAQVRLAKQHGFPVLTWTVNEPARAVELRGWGVDSLITDTPATIAKAIG